LKQKKKMARQLLQLNNILNIFLLWSKSLR
jgi:hypothetical protein